MKNKREKRMKPWNENDLFFAMYVLTYLSISSKIDIQHFKDISWKSTGARNSYSKSQKSAPKNYEMSEKCHNVNGTLNMQL